MSLGYQTKQHNQLLSLLKEHKNEELGANEILAKLKNAGVSISLATVYRQLESLISEGIVVKNPGKGGPRCSLFVYKGNDSQENEPFYLKCEICGKFTPLHCSELNHLKEHVLTRHNFYLTSKRTILFGICGSCGHKKENL